MEVNKMGVYIDIEENVILREIRDAGRAEGIAEGKAEGMGLLLQGQLESKFGRLPAWALERLHKASMGQVRDWGVQLLKADTIDGVLGKP
jgi:hypothetical protein